jgi:alpha-galactosidase
MREQSFDPGFMPFTRKIFRAFGYWPTCSDDHMGEYLPYGYEAGTHGYDFEGDEKGRVRTKKEIAEKISGKSGVDEWLRKSGEKAVEAITAMHTGVKVNLPAAIVYNGGAVKNLPADLAVEIPVTIDGAGVHKTFIDDLPDAAAALLNLQTSAQQMSVEAAVYGDKQKALQALYCDPVINSTIAAEKILDELWEINKPYIRRVI